MKGLTQDKRVGLDMTRETWTTYNGMTQGVGVNTRQ